MSCCGEETKTYKGRLSGQTLVQAKYWLPMDQTNPPAGGWGITLSAKRLEGFPDDHVDYLVHDIFTEAEAQQIVLDVYRERSGVSTYSDKPYVVKLDSKLPMSVVGPILWGWLSTELEHFNPNNFKKEIKKVYIKLDHEYSKKTGCPECFETFDKEVQRMEKEDDYPRTTEQAGTWLWKLHNEVNKKLGKREWTLQEAKDFWKWEW